MKKEMEEDLIKLKNDITKQVDIFNKKYDCFINLKTEFVYSYGKLPVDSFIIINDIKINGNVK